jgi:MerR family mercuric resistance operon transcriptional regulator
MPEELTIGQLARASDVNVETIRYYQRRELLDEPQKPLGGHRRYVSAAVRRVKFIRRAQQLGFTLEEVKNLLRLEDGGGCRETRQLAEQKVTIIEARIAALTRMRGALRELIAQCGDERARTCPIIATLAAGRDLVLS